MPPRPASCRSSCTRRSTRRGRLPRRCTPRWTCRAAVASALPEALREEARRPLARNTPNSVAEAGITAVRASGSSFSSPGMLPAHDAPEQRAARGEKFQIEFSIPAPGGASRHFEATGQPIATAAAPRRDRPRAAGRRSREREPHPDREVRAPARGRGPRPAGRERRRGRPVARGDAEDPRRAAPWHGGAARGEGRRRAPGAGPHEPDRQRLQARERHPQIEVRLRRAGGAPSSTWRTAARGSPRPTCSSSVSSFYQVEELANPPAEAWASGSSFAGRSSGRTAARSSCAARKAEATFTVRLPLIEDGQAHDGCAESTPLSCAHARPVERRCGEGPGP